QGQEDQHRSARRHQARFGEHVRGGPGQGAAQSSATVRRRVRRAEERQLKLALLIGVGAYENDRLPNLDSPASDVKDWAKILSSPELGAFDRVAISQDDDSHTLQDKIYDFLIAAKPDDFLLLYYSGHGRLHHE